MGGVEPLLGGHAGFAAEAGDELPVAVVAQDEVGTVAVGDVDIAVGRDGGLGGIEGHLRLIRADGGGVAEGENLTTGEVDLGDAARLAISTGAGFPQAAIRDEEEFGAVFVGEREAVAAGPDAAP